MLQAVVGPLKPYHKFGIVLLKGAGPSGRAVCDQSIAGVVGSNHAGGMKVYLLLVLCVVM
jgi:hypothetical protein